MGKQRIDTSFLELQSEWYERLAKEGFSDIEDFNQKDRPLKEWSNTRARTSSIGTEIQMIQPEYSAVICQLPCSAFEKEEAFLKHSNFESICISVTSNRKGRHCSLTPTQVLELWTWHCQGQSNRSIGRQLGTSEGSIRRMLIKLTEWMYLL